MKQVIWKFILKIQEEQEIYLPENSMFLTTREQYDNVCIWYKVCPDNILMKKLILIYGTGKSFDNINGKYLGSALLLNGDLVLHVFEK